MQSSVKRKNVYVEHEEQGECKTSKAGSKQEDNRRNREKCKMGLRRKIE